MAEPTDWPHEVTARGIRLSACLPHDLIARLGDKWTILVISLLSIAPDRRLRFSHIKYGMQEPLKAFAGWMRDNWPAIEVARQRFDAS